MKRERIWQAGVAAALVALVAWSAWWRWSVLASSPFPLGVDGYFYPIQLRALLESGSLQYPASPLTFWFLAPFAAATDPITGAKLGAAIGGALIALPAYAVGARLGGGRGPGLVAASIATMSASSAYLSIEFVKQSIGLTVALTALWLVLRALDKRSRGSIALALVGLGAALLTHKLAAALVIGIAVPAAIAEARAALRGRRLLYALVGAGVFAIVVLVLGLAMPQRFLSADDVRLLRDLVSSDAHVGAPALVTGPLTLRFEHDAAIGGIVAVVALCVLVARIGIAGTDVRAWHASWRWYLALPLTAIVLLLRWLALGDSQVPAASIVRRGRSLRIVAWCIVILGLVIGFPWLDVSDPQGLGFRLRIAAFVPFALAASIVAAAVFARVRQRDAILAAIALVIALRGGHERTEGRVVAHPALVAGVMAAEKHLPADKTVIVPERHILFMVSWYTRAPVSLRPEPVPYEQRVRMMPLAFIGFNSPLERALDDAREDPSVEPPIGVHPRHRNGLVIVSEATWEWLLGRLSPDVVWYWLFWRTI